MFELAYQFGYITNDTIHTIIIIIIILVSISDDYLVLCNMYHWLCNRC